MTRQKFEHLFVARDFAPGSLYFLHEARELGFILLQQSHAANRNIVEWEHQPHAKRKINTSSLSDALTCLDPGGLSPSCFQCR